MLQQVREGADENNWQKVQSGLFTKKSLDKKIMIAFLRQVREGTKEIIGNQVRVGLFTQTNLRQKKRDKAKVRKRGENKLSIDNNWRRNPLVKKSN